MRKIISITLLSFLVVMSACLKDKYKLDIVDNTDRVIAEFTNGSATNLNSLAVTFGTSMVEVDLAELRIPPRSAMSGNVQVKIILNPTLVSDYNSANGTALELPDGSAFQIPTLDFTLSPDARKTNVKIKINPSLIAGGSYALGFTIVEVHDGEVSQSKKDYLVELKVKNDYEGLYAASGTLTRYAGGTVGSGVIGVLTIDEEKELSTIDQTTVETTNGVSSFTGAYMYLQVDPATNNVTVSPSLTSPAFPSTANFGSCTYDPATKTFTLNYRYLNGAGALRVIQETLIKE